MASRFNSPNAKQPMWLTTLAPQVPACFSASSWRNWLDGVAYTAVANGRLRKALERGGTPDYCGECIRAHKHAMQAKGKCHPPRKTIADEEAV